MSDRIQEVRDMLEIIFIIAGIVVLCYMMILRGNAWQSFVDEHKKKKDDKKGEEK